MSPLPRFIWILLSSLWWVGNMAEAKKANPAKLWEGEYLRANQSAFYLKIILAKFPNHMERQFIQNKIAVYLKNLKTNEMVSVDHQLSSPKGQPEQIWKVKAGRYFLYGISIIDKNGKKRTWFPQSKRIVLLKPLSLANLGLWRIKPAKARGLSVQLKMLPNSFRESKHRGAGVFGAITDGFSGKTQVKLKGKEFKKAATLNFSDENTMRSNISHDRSIGMFYRINLGPHNSLGNKFNSILNEYDGKLRTCYTNLLEDQEITKLKVKFAFLINKSTGSLDKIRYNPKRFPNKRFRECLYFILAQIQFPFRQSIRGELEFLFEAGS